MRRTRSTRPTNLLSTGLLSALLLATAALCRCRAPTPTRDAGAAARAGTPPRRPSCSTGRPRRSAPCTPRTRHRSRSAPSTSASPRWPWIARSVAHRAAPRPPARRCGRRRPRRTGGVLPGIGGRARRRSRHQPVRDRSPPASAAPPQDRPACGGRLIASVSTTAGTTPRTLHPCARAGVWQPPATGMLAPWLGFVGRWSCTTSCTGPARTRSPRPRTRRTTTKYAGSAPRARPSEPPPQTDTALFFNSNSAIMLTEALVRRLSEHPLWVARTAWLFGAATARGRRGHRGLATEVRGRLLAADAGDRRSRRRRQPRHPAAGRVDLPPAHPAVLRLHQRARVADRADGPGGPAGAGGRHPAGPALVQHRCRPHLPDALLDRVRRAGLTDLGRSPLPQGHGRRVRDRPPDRGRRAARAAAESHRRPGPGEGPGRPGQLADRGSAAARTAPEATRATAVSISGERWRSGPGPATPCSRSSRDDGAGGGRRLPAGPAGRAPARR